MADPQVSPISQLLHTLGITREDLNKRSSQMRQFLTAEENSPSRVADKDSGYRSRSNSDLHSRFRSSSTSSSMARSISRTSSSSYRDSTPPITPIKSEAPDIGFPSRPYDSMEMVIERQRRQNKKERRSRREKERELTRSSVVNPPPSPSPSNASQPSVSLDSFMQSRSDRRAQNSDHEDTILPVPSQEQPTIPVTPRKNKYYREQTEVGSTSQPRKEAPQNTETPTVSRTMFNPNVQTSHYPYYPYAAYGPYYPPSSAIQNAQASTSKLPETPQTQRTQTKTPTKVFKSPLPPSSPFPSSPMSSPARAVNLVSSPGPIGPAPKEDEYDNLPYTLPPGPYSERKPNLSYAALVGQAVLSSPEHRLTLQEIYDWITIVYPYFKRGETTWMNSIRHVLSTTVCFRKVPRDRSLGRTQWAIWDEDLPCFEGGGFKKHLCKDYMDQAAVKEKNNTSKGKVRARKRAETEDTDTRKTKRARKDQPSSPGLTPAATVAAAAAGGSTIQYPTHFAPLFPPTRPTPHHQPYYESLYHQPQTLPADIIFPPLPATSTFNRVLNQNSNAAKNTNSSHEATAAMARVDRRAGERSPALRPVPSTSGTPVSISSNPGLTPNRHSSSSPSMPATSDMDLEGVGNAGTKCEIVDPDSQHRHHERDEEEQSDDTLPLSGGSATLKPVRFWGDQSKTEGLEPGINLLTSSQTTAVTAEEEEEEEEDDDEDYMLKSKTEGQKATSTQMLPFFVPPTSPTLERRSLKAKQKQQSGGGGAETHGSCSRRSTTPSPDGPSTPPGRQLQVSSVRTPISHKGLHMSPSTSLAHYKSHLDPPPPASSSSLDANSSSIIGSSKGDGDAAADPLRTPRKRKESTDGVPPALLGGPMTPRKLVFNSNPTAITADSPFRTPLGGAGMGASPYRTPRSRSIFDPHDPRTLLDDELNRRSLADDSPGGIFGKSRSELLYDSPGAMDSPGKYKTWW